MPAELGTHACDESGDDVVLQLIDGLDFTANGVGSGAGSCSVTVTVAADGVYSGTFVAELEGSTAGVLKVVTEGVFHYDLRGHLQRHLRHDRRQQEHRRRQRSLSRHHGVRR